LTHIGLPFKVPTNPFGFVIASEIH